MADLSFIGSCSPLVHPERHAWLAEIAQAFPGLKIWTDSFSGSAMATSRAVLGSLRRGRIRRVWNHLTSPLRAYAHTAVYGLPMFAQLHASRVTLNYHISLRQRSACNMRLFEATGAGACLVTDAMDDLCQIFEPDCEVVSYENAADCIERISWLHAHPSAAAEIAERGQRRTLRDHTFHERTLLLAELIERQLRRTNRV
jgi:spore maturation protein CgeB